MKRYIVILTLLLSSLRIADAFDEGFYFDYAWFKYDSTKFEFEFYYSFPNNYVTYYRDSTEFVSKSMMSIEFYQDSILVGNENWDITLRSEVEKPEYQIDILGQKNFILSEGSYLVNIYFFDASTDILFSKSFKLLLKKRAFNMPSLSSIQFALLYDSKKNPASVWDETFIKGDIYIIPNPYREFRGDSLYLKPYFEIYDAKKYNVENLEIIYTIYDAARRKVASEKMLQIPESDDMPIFKMFPLYKLPSGVYYFEASIEYQSNGAKHSTSMTKKFFSYNWSKEPALEVSFTEDELFQASEFATMDTHKVNEEFKQLKFILLGTEMQEYSLLTTLRAKQRALYKYWKLRDIDSLPTLNLAREKYKESIQFANLHFKCSNYPSGWETDRGRVMLKYGAPLSRDIYPSKFGKNATEIWFYEGKMAGSYFVFVDERGTNDFKLVHSTYPSEIFNDRWVEYYNPAIDDDDLNQDMFKSNSKEQY